MLVFCLILWLRVWKDSIVLWVFFRICFCWFSLVSNELVCVVMFLCFVNWLIVFCWLLRLLWIVVKLVWIWLKKRIVFKNNLVKLLDKKMDVVINIVCGVYFVCLLNWLCVVDEDDIVFFCELINRFFFSIVVFYIVRDIVFFMLRLFLC